MLRPSSTFDLFESCGRSKFGREHVLNVIEHFGVNRSQSRFRRAWPVRCGVIRLHKCAERLGNYVELVLPRKRSGGCQVAA
jgi:hypothetical protein